MKITKFKRTPEYRTFLGEFSKQWVGVMLLNGEIKHSVQRPTQQLADAACRDVTQPRFTLL